MSTPARTGKDNQLRPAVVMAVFAALALVALVAFWAVEAPAPASPPAVTQVERRTPEPRRPVRAPDFEPAPSAVPAAAPEVVPEEEPPPTGPTGMQLYPDNVKPVRRGLVVPEGFELPPGYMRHLQANEDGTLLPPILTFHPDYQPRDDAGRPIPMPEGRVVPPELAPPGMKLEVLAVPPPDFTDHGADGGV
ncbi:MAG: hypothetical protein ACOZQL_18920 [Myxococcota bacterium]